MPKMIALRRGLGGVLFWSIISAAFIGPGTVTTAAKAGATHQFQLLWALSFSIAAAIVLQEAAARITIASGKNLGEIIALRYAGRGRSLCVALFLAVAFGCAAYEAGNILGAVAGLHLLSDAPAWLLTAAVGIPATLLLWDGRYALIARMMGAVVFLMGFAFIYTALSGKFPVGEVLHGAVVPAVPTGSLLLIAGLIGTTIVPYNLFLASGIGQGQSVREMRLGLVPAILIGGVISMAIFITGTGVQGEFSYESLGAALGARLGAMGPVLFGVGLFAAGATSAITAPLAAAITARNLLGNRPAWRPVYFRWVWMAVLGTGLLFGFMNVKPIPAIILAQAANGVLLPFVASFLLLAVNDRKLLPAEFSNGWFANALLLLIVGVTCMLGLQNIWKSVAAVLAVPDAGATGVWAVQLGLTVLVLAALGRRVAMR
ncbi:MAG: Nramp family divalent metal transporter [Saprospiraceae bacterium]|nr:Nramp family divalent metal transporter [Saprospiraceae bacterium]